MLDGGYRHRAGFEDEIERATVGIYLRLTRHQVRVLEVHANAAGKSLKEFLRDQWEAEIARTIPPESDREPQHGPPGDSSFSAPPNRE
jgi:hypothetical protein